MIRHIFNRIIILFIILFIFSIFWVLSPLFVNRLHPDLIFLVGIIYFLFFLFTLIYTIRHFGKISAFLTSLRLNMESIYKKEDAIFSDPSDKLDEVESLELSIQHLSTYFNSTFSNNETERKTFSAILSNMSDGIMVVDSNGCIQMINPAAEMMFNVSGANVIGLSLVEVVRHHQLVDIWQISKDTQSSHSTTLETSVDRLFIQGIAAPLGDIMPGGILLVFQDLTRIRRLETVRKDFVSNVSHELRTPLASLKALSETLMEGALDDPPAAKRFLLRMEKEIDTLTQMVQELLELSKIESGRVPLAKKYFYPGELILSASDRMILQAQRAGINIQHHIPAGLPMIYADFERLGQVLINIIHNAIKFTSPGGKIELSVHQQGEKIIYSIKDNGVGISQDALSRIFERFYKTDRSRSGGGTGLGLSISRHLVEAHNGQIWAESKLGEGSTFYFSIPVA